MTSNIFVEVTAQRRIDKVDLLFMIDNSGSMSDKQQILEQAVPELLGRLLDPLCRDASGNSVASADHSCPEGFELEYEPVDDIHVGVISSSLGAPGTQACAVDRIPHANDNAHLIGRLRTRPNGSALETYQGLGFLAWDPHGKKQALGLPPGETDPARLIRNFQDLVVATDERGCGYEATLEAWYRFLVDPAPAASWVIENGSARPEGIDTALLEERRQFLRPDSLLAIVMLSDENDCSFDYRGDGWMFGDSPLLPRATSACAQNLNDACCRPCQQEPNGPPQGCEPVANDPACSTGHTGLSDPQNLRCFQQKRRFGLERLFPVERYISALSSATVLANDGSEHPNPLFTNLETGGVASRTPDLVFLAGIVGVPWQDIATADSKGAGNEQTLRYQTASELNSSGAWNLVLGDRALGSPPLDPLMLESVAPRQGSTPDAFPLALPESGALANPINGHEYYPLNSADLQFACIFPLTRPETCTGDGCDCDRSNETLTPLCQANDGLYADTQYHAKAYPGPRQLEVLRGAGASGIVASICPKLLPSGVSSQSPDPNAGYNPAVAAILDVVGTKLGGKCVPRQLAPDATGRVPCAMVEVLPRGTSSCTPCSSVPGRRDPSLVIANSVKKQLFDSGRCTQKGCPDICMCEIEQAREQALSACQNDEAAANPGYCYIDGALDIGNPALLGECPAERGLRFVGPDTPRNGAQTFIACVGAPYKDVIEDGAGN